MLGSPCTKLALLMCVILPCLTEPLSISVGSVFTTYSAHCVAHERAVLMRTALIPSSQRSCRTSNKQIRSLGNRSMLLALLVGEFHCVSKFNFSCPRQSWHFQTSTETWVLVFFVWRNQVPGSKDILWVLSVASSSADNITWGMGSSLGQQMLKGRSPP